MKTIIALSLVGVVIALASAGVFMLRRRHDRPEARDARMANALAWRIGLSVTLFLLILLGWQLGWIQPTGLPTGR